MPRSSAFAWKKRITLAAFGAGNHRHGMPEQVASTPLRFGDMTVFHGIQQRFLL